MPACRRGRDSIRVSEAPDPGSLPADAVRQGFLARPQPTYKFLGKAP